MPSIQKLDVTGRMYQVEVVDKRRRTYRIGPKLGGPIGERACEDLAQAIQAAIANGSEKFYREVCVVEITLVHH